ncbi:MAG TPA: alpha/beta hydrolase-fold protein [Chitinophagaceae bacterium]|nr:alpha/beta hydrolase-fold protein [Chitinophagaceae bacterium]
MQIAQGPGILIENVLLPSVHLDRVVRVDLYFPQHIAERKSIRLLLINDGQDLVKFNFKYMLDALQSKQEIEPLLCVGIHCGKERRMEYGTISYVDYNGRGIKAACHRNFVFDELLPFIKKRFNLDEFEDKAYTGFSLGGLSALDVTWLHPDEFNRAGVFSGSLWWRLRALDKGYIEETDRIMHKLIREGIYKPGLKFYFTTGSLDEKMDRNRNGIIDSIDDTLSLIEELEKKGYNKQTDIRYINYENGKHDVETWGKAMPGFLKWGWGRS